MAFLLDENLKELNEHDFFSFKMPTHIWKNDGMKQLQRAIKSMNRTDDILKTKVCVKLNNKYYAVIGLNSPEIFKGHIVNIEIDQEAPGDMSHAMTIEKFNQYFADNGITPREVDGWGLYSAGSSGPSTSLPEDESDKYDDELFITNKLASIVKSKDEKWIIFRFELNDTLKAAHDKKSRENGISRLSNLF